MHVVAKILQPLQAGDLANLYILLQKHSIQPPPPKPSPISATSAAEHNPVQPTLHPRLGLINLELKKVPALKIPKPKIKPPRAQEA
jgi:hypothetical protein